MPSGACLELGIALAKKRLRRGADVPAEVVSGALALRGTLLDCPGLRDSGEDGVSVRVIEDGLVVADGQKISYAGPYSSAACAGITCTDHRGKLLVPGFIDVHTHFAQSEMIAAYGEQLLDWLHKYTFPAEAEFADVDHSNRVAELFVSELVRNGTTTAAVYGTVHAHSVDAVAQAALAHDLQLVVGKVMMDRNCPAEIRDTPQASYDDSKALIERWHNVERLRYAITPRFAPTSTDEQLTVAAALWDEYPSVYLQTHVAENLDEVRWVKELFPSARSYLDVYARHQLLRRRAVLGHCIHLDADDRIQMQSSDATMAYCPSSNLFLGSGLFDLSASRSARQRVGIGTDVGAGTSFSMLRTLGEAYKVAQLRGQRCTPADLLYLATEGGAHALDLEQKVGSLEPGKDADIVVIDPRATALSAARCERFAEPLEQWFALCILGDDRHVSETYVRGRLVHSKLEGNHVR